MIEIVHIRDCPSWMVAGQRVKEALLAGGLSNTAVEFRLLETREDAAAVLFAGSPTILADGVDLFPTGQRTTELSCRVYATPAGLSGSPTTAQLMDALVAHGQ